MTNGTSSDRVIARNVKALREKQKKSLRHVAGLAGTSAGHLSRLERGERILDSRQLVAELAKVLGVTVADLSAEHAPATPVRSDGLHALMPAIRTALDVTDLPPDHSITSRPLPQLDTAVRYANKLAQAAKYEPMAQMLPGLLTELHTATHELTGRSQETAWGLLAEAARCGHSVGIAIGFNDLSVAALQRMDWAAEHAGDCGPGLRAIREYLRVTAYLRAREYDACWRLNEQGLARLDGTDPKTPGALVARGQLHLGASIIAAHTGDQGLMRDHLAEAEHISTLTGECTDQFWVGFGPTNVRVHRTMGLATAGEHGRAVESAEGIRFPSGWLPSRIGHHHLDMARAWRWLAKPEKALAALLAAREVAPGQARRHPLARDTVESLMRSARHPSTGLTEYARWIGIH
jgi:transcriptional regulator with XRE-family HTH domain